MFGNEGRLFKENIVKDSVFVADVDDFVDDDHTAEKIYLHNNKLYKMIGDILL